ncbi:BgTH12-07655 [Blumeria graminis f. sp. triticale]|uniref:BgTH12-07655 n=1 Tax=Blumeria graminis f. sp. triticale TaxID=1689686 RepID=A0A9W4CXQ7_BLUGR|nr:BgTH12-07655 [Blumeria graminis f. sp. triticale]
MILCVYALLYAKFKYHDNRPVHGKESDPSLVILVGDSKASFYGAFQAPSDGHFPAAGANSDIFSTEEIDGSEKTKIVAYCSPTLSSMEIIGSLVRDLPRLSRTQNIISDLTPQSEQECWNMIKKDWYNSFDAASSSGAKELVQNIKCSSRDIISLAHRGLLSVTGMYSTWAPKTRSEVPKVNIKQTLFLKELVPPNHIIAVWNENNISRALVWYFGHLHSFKRDTGSTLWWPETNIEENEKNCAFLLSILRHDFKTSEELDIRLRQKSWRKKAVDHFFGAPSCESDDIDKLNQLMAEINHMKMYLPGGTHVLD